MPKIIVQERRPLLRYGIAALLEIEDSNHVVDVVDDDDALRESCSQTAVDCVVLELAPPSWDVVELVGDIRRTLPNVRVAGLHEGRRSDHEATRSRLGLDALVPYGAGTQVLLEAIHPESESATVRPLVDRRILPSRHVLTPREREVLRHIAAGLTTQESAMLLDVSPKTVDNHKQRIFTKLGVQNQAHAVALGHRMGILQVHSVVRSG